MKMTKEDVGEMKKMGAKKFIAHEKADIQQAKKGAKKKAGKKGKK